MGQAKPLVPYESVSPFEPQIISGASEEILSGRYARLVGAPNCAPSLRSVAGLLGRSLDAACEDLLRLPIGVGRNLASRVCA